MAGYKILQKKLTTLLQNDLYLYERRKIRFLTNI